MIPAPAAASQDGSEFALGTARSVSVSEDGLLPIADRFRETVRRLAGVELPEPVVESAASRRPAVRAELGTIDVPQATSGRRADDGDPQREAYAIDIDQDGIRVRAAHPEGIHRGLTTVVHGGLRFGRIADAPRFAWRGLSVDTVRTFIPVDQLKRVIDMLSLYKMNVLHMHLTDNEGWRLEIESWPRLTGIGARGARDGRPGGFYTKDEFRALVAYARERFITVVPEIDLPGHVGAVHAAYPALVTGAAGDLHGYLDPDSDLVARFVRDVLTEAAALTEGAYLHIGADEPFGMPDGDHARFVSQVVPLVRELGKKAVGWQEAVRGDVGPDEIVQYWIDFTSDADTLASTVPADRIPHIIAMFDKAADDLGKAARKGSGVLLSPTAHAYLDRPYADQAPDGSRLGLEAYPATSIEAFADWEPDAEAVGVEAAIWCETVSDMSVLERLLLPRLPGVAEAGWAQPGRFAWPSYRDRLGRQAGMWRRAGWQWYPADSVDWVG
jgi:hexosaminidase